MRKTFLRDEKREEKKKQRMVIIIGLILVGIMILSSVAYIAEQNQTGPTGTSGTTEYGQQFSIVSGQDNAQYWQTKIGGEERQFIRLPTQVAYVNVSSDASSAFPYIPQLQSVVIAVDPTQNESQITLGAASLVLGDLYSDKKQVLTALTSPFVNITTLPIISCANQSYFDSQNLSGKIPIIQIQPGNETSITAVNNCIIIQGMDSEGILSAVERFRYGIWGLDFTKSATGN